MIKTNRREWLLICGLVLAVILIQLPVVYTYFYHDITGAPEAMNGSMDLSAVNHGIMGTVLLIHDNKLTRQLIEQITVFDKTLTIEFKSGLELELAR